MIRGHIPKLGGSYAGYQDMPKLPSRPGLIENEKGLFKKEKCYEKQYKPISVPLN